MLKLPLVILLVYSSVLCTASLYGISDEVIDVIGSSSENDTPSPVTRKWDSTASLNNYQPVFRTDYTYYEGAHGWFKLHRVPLDWHTARLQCYAEGAVLASPLNKEILETLKYIVNDSNVITDQIIGVHLGIHATFSDGVFASVEGVPLEKLAIEWGANEPNNAGQHQQCMSMFADGIGDFHCERLQPYICYRRASDVKLTECGTIDSAYTFSKKTGSCYKFHKRGETWPRAHRICQAEGGYLAIINSNKEAEVLKNIYQRNPSSVDTPTLEWPAVLLGGRQWGSPGSWWTVHGQTLEEAGFAQWGPGEPNSIAGIGGGPEQCLSMLLSGYMNDFSCDIPQPFICEIRPQLYDSN